MEPAADTVRTGCTLPSARIVIACPISQVSPEIVVAGVPE
jgi:hypothetical protein